MKKGGWREGKEDTNESSGSENDVWNANNKPVLPCGIVGFVYGHPCL